MLLMLTTALALSGTPAPPTISLPLVERDPGFVEWIPNNIKGGGGLGDMIVNTLALGDILRIDEGDHVSMLPLNENNGADQIRAATTHPE